MSVWPSMAWSERRSAPRSRRWLANEWRGTGGVRKRSTPAVTAWPRTNRPEAHAREAAPPQAQEEPGRAAPPGEPRPHFVQITHRPVPCHASEGHEAFLPSLAEAGQQADLEVDVARLEPGQLGDPQPGGVEGLEDRPVPDPERLRHVRRADRK